MQLIETENIATEGSLETSYLLEQVRTSMSLIFGSQH